MSYLGENIRRYRKLRNYSITELAERSQCSPATISQIENEKRDATFKMLLSIANALNIHISELVTPSHENFYSHEVKPLINFKDETYFMSGNCINSYDNKITWLATFQLINDISIVELITFNKPANIDVTFEDIFNHSLEQYLQEQLLAIITSKQIYLDMEYSQMGSNKIDATKLIELAKLFYFN